ncbi:hypothetical protein E5206_01690 [Arthrobacter sp. PAMC25564]|nr:hypothetical protein E5206_01690 [Arthrobacter sp. PAMC25564]
MCRWQKRRCRRRAATPRRSWGAAVAPGSPRSGRRRGWRAWRWCHRASGQSCARPGAPRLPAWQTPCLLAWWRAWLPAWLPAWQRAWLRAWWTV